MRFSAPSRVDAVAPWYRSGAKATNPAVASRSHRPFKKSFRPHHAWRTRRAGPLPVFGTARYPETFPSGLLSSTIVIFHIAVTGEWPIRHLNLRLNGHRRSTPPVRTQKEDGSDSNTRLPHSTIRRSSQYSVKCRKPAARWCEESGLLKGLPPIWSACSPRWPSLRSCERRSSRSDNVPRSCTGAYRRAVSSMPPSRDFKTALLDPRSWRSTRA